MSSNFSYEYERDDYYCYPWSVVLKNKLNLLSEIELNVAEREITGLKSLEFLSNPFSDKLDFNYIKKLHRHLFSDIYEWAGEIRKIDISKGNIFCQHELIEINAEALFNQLEYEKYLAELNEKMIIERLATYLGDLNTIHPFREGNGRVQRLFIRGLAHRSGYLINFDSISNQEMVVASDSAFHYDYNPMIELISKSIKRV